MGLERLTLSPQSYGTTQGLKTVLILFRQHTCKNQALLIRRDSLLVLDFRLDHVDSVG